MKKRNELNTSKKEVGTVNAAAVELSDDMLDYIVGGTSLSEALSDIDTTGTPTGTSTNTPKSAGRMRVQIRVFDQANYNI